MIPLHSDHDHRVLAPLEYFLTTPDTVMSDEDPRSATFLAYMTIGALAIMIWNILSELPMDFQLLHSREARFVPKISYITSRATMLAYIHTDAISQTTPLGSCILIHHALISLYMIAIPTTSLLIFYRVRAVFLGDGFITGIFGALWLFVVGGSATIISGASIENIAPTKYCTIVQKVTPYFAGSLIGPLLYVCLAYMFISAKLVSCARMDFSMRLGLREFILGEFVPVFSKGLLEDGQAYYLLLVIFQLISFIIFVSTSTTTRFMLVDSSLALMNIMACKAYRNSVFKEEEVKLHKINIPIPLAYLHSDPLLASGHLSYNLRGIQVTKTIEHD